MIVVDTFADRKAIIESSYMNIPVIALANTDSNLQFVDVAIPCNNKSTESISMIFWLLAREVQYLTGKLNRGEEWNVIVDLFYYKTLEQAQKYQEEAKITEEMKEDDDKGSDEEGDWDNENGDD